MAGVRRWRFSGAGESYTVPLNPREMTPLFPDRAVTGRRSTGGTVMLFEGETPLTQWSFTGAILDEAHHEALRHWVYDIKQRIVITDHFGRDIECVLTSFKPVPRRSVSYRWRHEYTITALVVKVGPVPGSTAPFDPWRPGA